MFGSGTRTDDLDKHKHGLKKQLFLLLFLLVCAVFHPVVRGEFLFWDDDFHIFENPHLTGLSWEQLKWIFTGTEYFGRYQPLLWLGWSVIKSCVGLNPFWFHLIVLLYHASSAGLVFLMIRKLLLLAEKASEETAPAHLSIAAALGAALWAVHPMRAETTAWAVEMGYAQALFLFLLSFLCFLRSTESSSAWRSGYYWVSLALFLASLISFPIAMGGFVVFIALEIYPLRRLSVDPWRWLAASNRRIALEKLPFVAVAVLVGWVNLHVRSYHGGTWTALPTLNDFPPAARVMQAFYIWAYYIWRPLWPVHLTPFPTRLMTFRPFEADFVLSAILVLGLSAWLFLQRRRWPAAFVVLGCHLGLLVPMLGLSEHPHYPSDRYDLIVGICWAALFAGWLEKSWPWERGRRVLLGGTAVVILLLALMSYNQALIWQTNDRFLHYILSGLNDSPLFVPRRVNIYTRLARAYSQHGDTTNAVASLRTAAALMPEYAPVRVQLGNTLMAAGQPEAARATFDDAARLDPQFSSPFNDLGVAFAQQGKLDLATEQFARALGANPANPSALKNMATALQQLGKTNEAQAYLRKFNAPSAAPSR